MVVAEIDIGCVKIVWRQGLAVFSIRACNFLCLLLEASGSVVGLCVTATVCVALGKRTFTYYRTWGTKGLS
jgi:hypothetical protein